ncbi:unnamed protein product, partial [Ectocarpus fasciculatus]
DLEERSDPDESSQDGDKAYEETHGSGKGRRKKARATYSMYQGFGVRILVGLKTLERGHMIVAVCPWSGYCWLGRLEQKDADAMATFLRDVVLREVEDIKGGWTPTREDLKRPDGGEVSIGIAEKHGGVSVFKVRLSLIPSSR